MIRDYLPCPCKIPIQNVFICYFFKILLHLLWQTYGLILAGKYFTLYLKIYIHVNPSCWTWGRFGFHFEIEVCIRETVRWHFYAPPPESGGVLCYTLRNFECLSVRPSVSAHHHSCIGNSSYSFRPILLKLYRCFKDGLKICILFFQNPEIIFYHFFPIFNLDIFRALILQICIWSMYLVSATPPTVFGKSFWNFTGVLRMVWRYAYCFFRILKLFFITFFVFLT